VDPHPHRNKCILENPICEKENDRGGAARVTQKIHFRTGGSIGEKRKEIPHSQENDFTQVGFGYGDVNVKDGGRLGVEGGGRTLLDPTNELGIAATPGLCIPE